MRLSVIAACLSLCLIGFATANDAHASIRKDTNIPAEGLGPALNALAKDRNFQIVYVTEEIANLRTAGATGLFTQDEALKRLLVGTGLSYRYLDDRTVTILPVGNDSTQNGRAAPTTKENQTGDRSGAKEGKKSSSGEFLVAQVDQGTNPRSSSLDGTPPSSQDSLQKAQLTEIIVTAQKRTERLIDVPISIVVLGGDEMQRRGIVSVDDLASTVPGLAMESNGYQRRIEIRGISNSATTGVGNTSLIGMYLDEADVTSAATNQLALSTYDLERVEVLRGPQGTLYGDGSAGGTVRFITKSPELDKLAANADIAALFTEDGAPGQRINLMLNVPVISNELALRITGTFDHEGGWINQPAADRQNINEQDLTDVRVKALWKPSSQLTVSAMAEIHRNSTAPNNGEDANGNYTQTFGLTATPFVKDDFNIFNLTVTYDFSAARILSTTSYVDQDKDLRNFGYSVPLAPPSPSTPPFELFLFDPQQIQNLNEELRLTSVTQGPWQWTVGGYYRHFRYDSDQSYYFGAPGPLPAAPFFNETDSLSKSWAAFGDTNYKLTERLTVGAGLRYYDDDQEFTGTLPAASTQDGAFHSLSPRAYAQFKLTDEANVYASAAKGFRSGGFNGAAQPTYGPENVWTYELGTKTSLMGGSITTNAAVFYSNYTGYQAVGLTAANPINITRNAGDAHIKGIEADFTWRPSDQWSLGINGNVMDAKFYKIDATGTNFAVGDDLDLVPKYTLTTSAERDFSVDEKPAYARLEYDQIGRQSLTARGLYPSAFSESDIVHMLNFSTGVRWSDHLSLNAFAQNLLNFRGYTDPQSIFNYATRSRPRTVGIQFSATF